MLSYSLAKMALDTSGPSRARHPHKHRKQAHTCVSTSPMHANEGTRLLRTLTLTGGQSSYHSPEGLFRQLWRPQKSCLLLPGPVVGVEPMKVWGGGGWGCQSFLLLLATLAGAGTLASSLTLCGLSKGF